MLRSRPTQHRPEGLHRSERLPQGEPAIDPALDLLSPEEERSLAQRAAGGDRHAAERLVLGNLRLVWFVAQRYSGRGVPLEDLVQEGTIGLIGAVEKYEWDRGIRFATYAVWWIRLRISRAITNTARPIRLPEHAWRLLRQATEAEHRLTQRYQRPATLEDIAAEAGVSPDKLHEVWAHRSAVASLDRQLVEDGDSLADLLPHSTEGGVAGQVEDALQSQRTANALASLLDTLTPRERHIIRLRFGFGATEPAAVGATLAEVASTIGLSGERVRQIERLALAKLRHRARLAPWRQALIPALEP